MSWGALGFSLLNLCTFLFITGRNDVFMCTVFSPYKEEKIGEDGALEKGGANNFCRVVLFGHHSGYQLWEPEGHSLLYCSEWTTVSWNWVKASSWKFLFFSFLFLRRLSSYNLHPLRTPPLPGSKSQFHKSFLTTNVFRCPDS